MIKVTFFFTLLLTFNRQAHSIIGGERLLGIEVPQMQPISKLADMSSTHCSATLIGPRVIITAAHCITNGPDYYFAKIKVRFTKHPDFVEWPNIPYDLANKFDIALGILDRTVTTVNPITITKEKIYKGRNVLFMGAGRPRRGARQFGYANIFSFSDIGVTIRSLNDQKQVNDTGDSGGPAFFLIGDEVQLFGINSTSTRANNHIYEFGEIAKPYTMGISRLTQENNHIDFLETFIIENTLEICGINKECAPVYFSKNKL